MAYTSNSYSGGGKHTLHSEHSTCPTPLNYITKTALRICFVTIDNQHDINWGSKAYLLLSNS